MQQSATGWTQTHVAAVSTRKPWYMEQYQVSYLGALEFCGLLRKHRVCFRKEMFLLNLIWQCFEHRKWNFYASSLYWGGWRNILNRDLNTYENNTWVLFTGVLNNCTPDISEWPLTSCSFSHKRSSRSWMMSSDEGEGRRGAGASLRWLSLW